MLSSWVGIDCCSWKGVSCDGATGNVVSLHLNGNCLIRFYNALEPIIQCLEGDKVNAYLAELRHLKHLDLSGNYFYGSLIPEFIGSFTQLSYLNLSNMGFSGNIPHHIGNLSNLKVLDLRSSYFPYMLYANDMAWVSGLSSLEHLDLGWVGLYQAKNLDMVFYTICPLTYLSLSGCGLSNAHLSLHLNSSKMFPNIEHLDLSQNVFEGQLPHFFQNMTSLMFLDISSFNLSRSWNSLNLLTFIPSLSELHLSSCGLHNAHFSPNYFNFSAHSVIQYLDLSYNWIEGIFPSQLMNMTSLRVLLLSNNILNSSIPVMLNLQALDISYNNYEHIKLVGIWKHCQLKELSISGNFLGEELIGPSTNMSECSQYDLEVLISKGNQLTGSIPESFGRLVKLRVLNLNSNNLTGSLPKALERLRLLEVVDLSYNDLTGPIPTFLGNLTKLHLSGNHFNGSIPESLGRLRGLTELDLSSNQLIGPIPSSLGRLTLLQKLFVSSNLLNGTIPLSIWKLTKLILLDISNNYLEGVVSEAHLSNLSSLVLLYTTSNHKLIYNISHEWIPPFQLNAINLGSCKIANGFPHWLQTQKKLQVLVLSDTGLYGPLPAWLQKMPFIMDFNISYNMLHGSLLNLPFSEGKAYFALQDNLFNESIPQSLCRRTGLAFLDIARNRLSGNVPDCLLNLQQLVMLILSSNGLSGVLPGSLINISSPLEWLKLDDNNFSGELPQDFGNLRSLRVLDLGNNKFSEEIPTWIGAKLSNLWVLRLHNNNFTGAIPQSLCKCSRIHILDLAHNNLSGSIPHCFGEFNGMIETGHENIFTKNSAYDVMFENMDVIQFMKGTILEYTTTLRLVFNMDLSSNQLIGEIPEELTTLTLLVGLNLSHNHLNGSIPGSIGNMKELNSLDFSNNQFTGTIPPSIASLNFLSHLNLSHNNLSGRIPTGSQLQTLNDPSIYVGNIHLCGEPLPNNCSKHENPTTTPSKNKYARNAWFYTDIICGFATGFWGLIGVLSFKKQWRHKLFTVAEVTMDKVYIAVAVWVSKIKRGIERK
ncbi:hypothetical protein QVD17_32255 [Tagetes erecta]|uniref:Leucine-rich repeat-containing N-terminal plant-type domain-containing protein n=1 Tax=Tagetes erecta TaxID=13708 RepID=A0AAD8NPA4_TARER|nr:hypothetical protein QVD17_32255 [Tagetes erecta]